jgi:hypothetical protein
VQPATDRTGPRSPGVWRLAALAWLALAVALAIGGLRGPRLLVVDLPEPAGRIGLEGLELLVGFDERRAEASTFRVLLNGADVTDEVEVATNGAHGVLHGLLEGSNTLELEIFGRGLWPSGVLVEERHVRRVMFRPPQGLDQV